jgi:flagellar hook-associated protein 3 FlgL
MMFMSVGDQARAFNLQMHSSRLKDTLSILTQELGSGEVHDVAQRLNGNTRPLSAIESQLNHIQQFQLNAAEVSSVNTALDQSLGRVQDISQALAAQLAFEGSVPTAVNNNVLSLAAMTAFEDTVAQLNSSRGGQYLLSGSHLDIAPLLPAPDILDMLQSLVAGLSTSAEIEQAIVGWFDAPAGDGGFIDLAYQGSGATDRIVPISSEQKVAMAIDATTEPIRKALAGLAMGALVQRGAVADTQQTELLKLAGEHLRSNDAGMSELRATLGLTEQRVSIVKSENEALMSHMKVLRNAMREADPYETASAITAVEGQLDALFSVQARLSNLHLASYLR